METRLTCACGHALTDRDSARCPHCGREIAGAADGTTGSDPAALGNSHPVARTDREPFAGTMKMIEDAEADPRMPGSGSIFDRVEDVRAPAPVAHARDRWRDMLLVVVLAAFLPLVSTALHPEKESFEARLQRTFDRATPEQQSLIAARFEEVQREERAFEDIFEVLPEHRLSGALLPRDSRVHWLFAIAAGAAFFGLVSFVASREAPRVPLLLAGLFTATIGILMLLAFQFIADLTQGVWLRGHGIITIFFYIVKFIGFSYRAASDPSNGFLLSFVGFTCGVGFCEEACKAFPVVCRQHTGDVALSWRGAVAWGLVSGAGFGVAEGIMYAGRYYNGVSPAGIYVVRFVSCVALHAIWAASVGMTAINAWDVWDQADAWHEYLVALLRFVAVPMVLHGLYDTLLKRSQEGLAVAVAFSSALWLGWQIWDSRRREGIAPEITGEAVAAP